MGNLFRIKNRVLLFAAICFVLASYYSVYSYGSQRMNRGIQPKQLRMILSMAGVEAEVINLKRNDRFDTGLFFESKDGIAILLGFTENGFRRNRPFLLSNFNSEAKAVILTDGNLYVFEDGRIASEGAIDDILRQVAELVECILNASDEMVQAIDQCSLDFRSLDVVCIIDAVSIGVRNITGCVF